MAVDYQTILSYLGEKSSEVATKIIQKVSESLGIETGEFTGKLSTILVFAVFIYLASKLTHKLAKISIIGISILLIISIGYSFFV